ncbi:hypothetical protein [Paractinoplanes toevensis]|uniref:hypothetical protein n=1 Tax=Paractinoplanes toevensis TaxID=571911 RepID=UPI001BB35A0C|nr:hypothetical protein [Actinoplanes toevensis]
MGADAEIFVFDYERYRGEVVPALTALLRTGSPATWLADLFTRAAHAAVAVENSRPADHAGDDGYDLVWPRLAGRFRSEPVDLVRHCTWLGSDLRYAGPTRVDRSVGKRVRCGSLACPERPRCPFHRDNDPHGAEPLNVLHEALIATRCLGPSVFVGRTITPDYYVPLLERWEVPAADPVRGLLDALATRGAALGHQYGVTEGIHGWLTVAETAELAATLTRLPLPRYPPTFAAMTTQKASPEADDDWPATSLSFIRTVATIAAAGGRSILWANDVSPESWREELGLPND